jgi:hypothetical protein
MRLGSKCAVPMTEDDRPSGRPEIGGWGSLVPTTSRTGGAGGAIAGSGVSEAPATLPDLGRSAIAESGLAASFGASGLAGPTADASRALAGFFAAAAAAAGADTAFAGCDAGGDELAPALAAPPSLAVERNGCLVDGGGCGGNPAEMRCLGGAGSGRPGAGAAAEGPVDLLDPDGATGPAADRGAP